MEAVRQIHLNTMKVMIKEKADVKVAKIELMEILTKDPVDMTAAEAAVKKDRGLENRNEDDAYQGHGGDKVQP